MVKSKEVQDNFVQQKQATGGLNGVVVSVADCYPKVLGSIPG
jgi:hypothetical protein